MARLHKIEAEPKVFLSHLLEQFPSLLDYSAEAAYNTIRYAISNGAYGSLDIDGLRGIINVDRRGVGGLRLEACAWKIVEIFFSCYPHTVDRTPDLAWYWSILKAEIAEET